MFSWTYMFLLLSFACVCNVKSQEKCPTLKNVDPCKTLSCEKFDVVTKIKVRCVDIPPSFDFHKIFDGLDAEVKIKSLRIINSGVTNFAQVMFEHKELTDISISKTNITSLSKDTFKGTSLEYLDLIHCNLEDKPDFIENIRHISKLKSLHISQNHLKKIKSSWFEEPRHSETLISLSLKQNDISVIEDLAFHKLHSLEYLDLSQNKIQNVKRNFFPEAEGSRNQLKSLSLAYNKIEELPDDVFDEMEHLRFLRLEYNNIKQLKGEVFKNTFLQQLREGQIDLRGNPINCDCFLEWLPNRDKPGRFYGECDSPEALRKRPLTGIKLEDLKCAHSTNATLNKWSFIVKHMFGTLHMKHRMKF